MERFYNIHGDDMEADDIKPLATKLYKISQAEAVKSVSTADTVEDAFYYLDILGQELEDTANHQSPTLAPITREVFKILCFGLYSYEFGWDDDWDTLEGDIINYLPNNVVKNWEALTNEDSDHHNYFKIMDIITRRFLKLLWKDLKDQKIDTVSKFKAVEEFRVAVEGEFDTEMAYGSDWFIYEYLLKATTYGDLLDRLSERANTLIYVDWDSQGNEVYGDTKPTDYLYLLSDLIAKCEARFLGGASLED